MTALAPRRRSWRRWLAAARHLLWQARGRRLVDLPCGCQDVVDWRGRVVDREHDHVQCDGAPR